MKMYHRSPCFRAVSFHPVPMAMATVVFLSRKKLTKGFSLNATFLFSKTKWKTWETDNSYLCLPQLVKRGYFNSRTFFVINSWLLRKGSQQFFSPKKITEIFWNFNRNFTEDLSARQECSHKLHITPPWQWQLQSTTSITTPCHILSNISK